MKRLIGAFLGICALVVLLTSAKYVLEHGKKASGEDVVTLYNWGDYIDPDLITQFEEETGYQIEYETFDSNEAMLAKIEQVGTSFDLAVPSDYMIELMIQKEMLLPLDHKKIQGMEHLDKRFLDLPFDPNNRYSIPYFWGTLGILANEQLVDVSQLTSWQDLWKEEFKDNLLLYDGAREVLGFALQAKRRSLNDRNIAHLKEARDDIWRLLPNVRGFVADEIKMYMVQEEAALAVTFSGEASAAMEESDYLVYIIPQEGSNIWFDNLVIPKTARNLEGVYAFINFMLRPEVAAQNSEYIGYSTPNKEALNYIDPELLNNPAFYPDEAVIEELEMYLNLGQEILIQYNNLYLEAKMGR
ncbi:ABC transporter substrate-binding protein [Dolosicoccus paucivorans]|uniref:Spermidine/putrescine ABC transporter substrate-binding protein n=1 Tax=Dolosicoccus paucivorans TaxID=84521 RepID=A0A1G8IL47_9LACT|nr:ABC transporter substrate-binding protein [Dolosicoccus paucivorans]PMB84927.1 spermidine/putrescine ABC transporter substrate-binding protein [Dolosicoccus paucivorans]PMC58698.1 spermidine/putrescine ABC transporter substrate-binding protein [Dolosicoccus paucivorans]SDI19699.1 spermidine/putrescine transport system substrate-binding protein [Dolosicoccus paucivorans]